MVLERDAGKAMGHIAGMFDHFAKEARLGRFLYAGVSVTLTDNNQAAYAHAGLHGFENDTREAIRGLDLELDAILDRRRFGKRDLDLSASCVEYPLWCPISWDFWTWLVYSEMTRVRLGGPAPLRVAFTHQEMLEPVRADFFHNVFRQLLPLIGAIEDPKAEGGRHYPFYTASGVMNAARNGEKPPKIKATLEQRRTMELYLHGTKPVVITVRETPYFPERNSNLEAWLHFADDLQKKGKDVIIVRDTARANEPLPGFCTCPVASYDVLYRAALYELAEFNFCVANGPGNLIYYGELPYALFINLKENDSNTLKSYHIEHGLDKDQQLPWATPQQRLIWSNDNYKNICEAWEQYEGLSRG